MNWFKNTIDKVGVGRTPSNTNNTLQPNSNEGPSRFDIFFILLDN